MATITVYDFPNIIPDTSEWGIITNTQVFASPLSGDEQTSSTPGAKWSATLDFQNLTQSNARDLFGFLLKIKGPAGRFRLYDHSLPTPRGTAVTAGSYAKVDGAFQVGNTILTKDWGPNQANLLRIGDYFQIGNELKMIVATATSNASGASTLVFEPPIRNAPANGSNIILTKPSCIMRLTDDEQVRWANAESILLSGITFSCIEVYFNG